MRKLLFALLFPVLSFAQTIKSLDTVRVENLIVKAGSTLDLRAGSVVYVSGNVNVEFGGTLISNGTLVLNGSKPQIIAGTGKFINSYNMVLNAVMFTNLVFDNSYKDGIAVTFNCGSANKNVYVSGNVDFINGVISVPVANHMYFTENATASRVNGFLVTHSGRIGTMSKCFGKGNSSFTYHIGDNLNGYDYSPVSIDVNDNSLIRWFGVRVEDQKPINSNTLNYLSRYWDLYGDITGTWKASFSFNYLPSDVVGDESKMNFSRWNGSGWETFSAKPLGKKLSFSFNQNTLLRKTKAIFTAR